MSRFDLIAFDADDTLWRSEDGFRANELHFVDVVAAVVRAAFANGATHVSLHAERAAGTAS